MFNNTIKEIYDFSVEDILLWPADDNNLPLLPFVYDNLKHIFPNINVQLVNIFPSYLRDWAISLSDGRLLFNTLYDHINVSEDEKTDGIPLIILKKMLAATRHEATAGVRLLSHLESGTYIINEPEDVIPRSKKKFQHTLAKICQSQLHSLPINGGNIIALQKLESTQQVFCIGENSKLLLQVMDQSLPDLMKMVGFTPELNCLFIPQSSYHIDFDIAAPKPGVVILNDFTSLLQNPSLYSLLVESIKKFLYPSASCARVLDPFDALCFFKKQQTCLDAIEKILIAQNFTVVRALGNLHFSSYEEKSSIAEAREARSDTLPLFNFINGIPVKNVDGQYHFITLAAHHCFHTQQTMFQTSLQRAGIQCHFLTSAGESISAHVLDKNQAGLRCLTLIIPKPKF